MFTNVSIELKLPGIYHAGKRHIKAVNRDDVHDLIPSEILTGTFLCRFANSAAFNELVDDTQQNTVALFPFSGGRSFFYAQYFFK